MPRKILYGQMKPGQRLGRMLYPLDPRVVMKVRAARKPGSQLVHAPVMEQHRFRMFFRCVPMRDRVPHQPDGYGNQLFVKPPLHGMRQQSVNSLDPSRLRYTTGPFSQTVCAPAGGVQLDSIDSPKFRTAESSMVSQSPDPNSWASDSEPFQYLGDHIGIRIDAGFLFPQDNSHRNSLYHADTFRPEMSSCLACILGSNFGNEFPKRVPESKSRLDVDPILAVEFPVAPYLFYNQNRDSQFAIENSLRIKQVSPAS